MRWLFCSALQGWAGRESQSRWLPLVSLPFARRRGNTGPSTTEAVVAALPQGDSLWFPGAVAPPPPTSPPQAQAAGECGGPLLSQKCSSGKGWGQATCVSQALQKIPALKCGSRGARESSRGGWSTEEG